MVFCTTLRRSLPELKPLFDRVVVRRQVPRTSTPGGIMLPESEADRYHEGTVVAVGAGVRTETGATIPTQLKKGDRVLLPQFGGQKIKVDQEELSIYKEVDIVAVIGES